MKVRLAAVLSLTGVLVAGSVAALVNTRVLDGAARNADGVTLTDETIVDSRAAPGATAPPFTTVAGGVSAPAGTQALYQVGVAGLVTLDSAGEQLSVISVVPNEGWDVVEAKNDDAFNIRVSFQSSTTRVEFQATLLFGIVGTSVATESLVPGGEGDDGGGGGEDGGGVSSVPASSGVPTTATGTRDTVADDASEPENPDAPDDSQPEADDD